VYVIYIINNELVDDIKVGLLLTFVNTEKIIIKLVLGLTAFQVLKKTEMVRTKQDDDNLDGSICLNIPLK